MNTSNPINLPPGLVERVKNIIMKPKEEWPAIEAEQTGIPGLYTRYVAILAAIPALATFLRAVLFGYGMFGFSYRPGFVAALAMGISQYVMAFVSVAIVAFITDFLVTKFDGTANRTAAFKLSAYSATAAWLAGIFNLIPGLGILGLLGLYSFYLFYTGLPVLMKVPQEKALVCTIVVALASIILSIVAGAVLRPVSAMFDGPVHHQGMPATM
ncbi:MAG: Yip1 family protein [Sphingobium sp.]